ncbi:MAG: DUF512 domain-containing protein [bacterium]
MNEPNLNNGNNKKNIIIKVEDNSIAEEMGVNAGDILISINDSFVKDVLDYRYLIQDEYIDLLIEKPNGEEWLLEIDKDEYEDLGIVFESGLMDKAKSCTNRCIFCFIDQNPKGMRKTIYFKDDDSRLSFLQGNYITLTNMSDEDLDRIIFYHLSPINISVHATDMEVRKFMLKNPKSMRLMEQIAKLAEAGIKMNFQIVLCKNINDGEVLSKSIEDLSKYVKLGCSMAVVPIGLTKHRENLYPLEHLMPEDLSKTIKQVTEWQERLLKKYGTRFVFLSDEFYLQSKQDFPKAECYEDYPQLDNGVGMIPLLKQECFEYLDNISEEEMVKKNTKKDISIITGTLAYPVIKEICAKINNKFSNININVYAIINNFYGKSITVSGLLTGGDIIAQLRDKNLGDILYIPKNCIRTNDTVFLDDLDIKDVEKELNIEICLSSEGGDAFVRQFLE